MSKVNPNMHLARLVTAENSKFNVVIYDTTSVEISYPFKSPSTRGEPNTTASKRAKDAANGTKPKNPSFRSKSYDCRYAYVPAEFAAEYLKPNVRFKLQNSQGKQWEVYCVLSKKGAGLRITFGFFRFARENNLSDGVIYEFQLIKRKPAVVLQVTASHTRIPEDFITKYGNKLKNVATITVPDGLIWKMELMKCDENVFFSNKWKQFAEYYSIGYGCYLSFKYEGNSNFSVIIFDATSVEICYPNTDIYSLRKRSRIETSESQGKKIKSMFKDASKRAEDAANAFNPKNPFFRSKCAKGRYVYVSSKFASKYLNPNGPIKLQNSHGEQWEVSSIFYNPKSSSMRIVKGVMKFERDNNLSHEDYCVFELIKKKPVVLKVTMFRAVDYRD